MALGLALSEQQNRQALFKGQSGSFTIAQKALFGDPFIYLSADGLTVATTVGSPALTFPDVDTQVARPASTTSNSGWETNNASPNLYSNINESVASDAEYIRGEEGSIYRAKLAAFSNVAFVGLLKLSYRLGSEDGRIVSQTVRLFEGAVLVDEWLHTGLTSFTTFDQWIDPSLVTDFNNLYVEVEVM